jgi:hypothetical protein
MKNRPVIVWLDPLRGSMGVTGSVFTSPSNRRILKLRLLILSCGELGKHTMQLVNEYTTSRK